MPVAHREEIFQKVVEAAPNAMVMVDRNGLIVLVNAEAENTFHYSRDELIGHSIEMLVPQNVRTHHPKLREDYFSDPQTRQMGVGRELFGLTKDSRKVPVEIGLNPIETTDGLFVLASIINITERKAMVADLERSEQRFRMMVSSVKDYALFTIDAQGNVTSWNEGARRLKGYDEEEILGKHFSCFYSSEDRAAEKPAQEMEEAAKQGQWEGEEWRYRKDGSIFWANVILSAMRDENGVLTGFSTVTRDLTEYRRDEELKNLNLSLRQQVSEKTLALTRLREAQDQLVQAEKLALLGELVAGVAHEVNTPIGVAVTAASTLQYSTAELQELHQCDKLTSKDLGEYVLLASEATKLLLYNLNRAAELVQSFKQVAVDQSSSERREIDLCAYISEVLLSLAPKLKNTGHRVSVECLPTVQVDSYPGAIFQILTNLVSNSILHAFPENRKGNMYITAREEDKNIVMSFRDDGVGMSSENIQRVFEPFFTTKRGSGGSGLGLHIVHNLVTKALGGSISVVGGPGNGLDFRIIFPKISLSPTLHQRRREDRMHAE